MQMRRAQALCCLWLCCACARGFERDLFADFERQGWKLDQGVSFADGVMTIKGDPSAYVEAALPLQATAFGKKRFHLTAEVRMEGVWSAAGRSTTSATPPGSTRFAWPLSLAWTAGGCLIEAALPWTALGMTPKMYREFLFDIGIDDGDDGARRLRQLMWNGTARNSSDRSGWARARLVQ